jgi:hypothetical protein
VTPISTTVSPKPSALYFRHAFDLTSTTGGLTISTYADDGIVVYVNGVEVGRSNLAAGAVTGSTFATSAPNTAAAIAAPVTFAVPADVLRVGGNVIAVQVVSNYRSSPSVTFELSATRAG